jgi:hypothetical protein
MQRQQTGVTYYVQGAIVPAAPLRILLRVSVLVSVCPSSD